MKEENLRELMEKRLSYADYVKEAHPPKISKKKELELKMSIEH
jgi:hypothetical protein